MRSPIDHYSISAYLESEAKSQIRHEYVDGEVFAMAEASEEHNLINVNLIAVIRPHLRGSTCRVFASDMKVKIKVEKADIFYYPDLMVICNLEDNQRYFKTNPKLIIEVLSKSAQIIDQREKRLSYQNMPGLEEYVLIAQDRVRVEIYRQDLAQNWTKEILDAEQDLILNSINFTLKMTEIYEDIF